MESEEEIMSLKSLNYQQRQQFIEQQSQTTLVHSKQASFNVEEVTGRNCENIIGVTQVPLGVAGPLKLILENKEKTTYIPLATTEGALVASINRGMKATFSNGITVKTKKVGATRGVAIQIKDLAQSELIISFLKNHWSELVSKVKQHEQHADLLDWHWQMLGRYLYIRFVYDTHEAMGMNMVTIASKILLDEIQSEFDTPYILSANYCIDKKASYINAILGRGIQVWAEAAIPHTIVSDVLKTTPEKIVELVLAKQLSGSALAGSMGYNGHFANIAAAIYVATGQDPAHVVEASQGFVQAWVVSGDLHFAIHMPALMVGTVGGGTQLPTQSEALQIMGIKRPFTGSSIYLAQCIAGAVLAGELSLTAALANNTLACAHQKLGRGKI